MSHCSINNLKDNLDQEVTVKGWLHNARSKGKIVFLLVRDGTGVVQTVAVKGKVDDELFETCARIGKETSLLITGTAKSDDRAPGGVELALSNIEVLQEVEDYPIAKQTSDQKGPSPDFLLERRHLWLRSDRQVALLRLRSRTAKAIRDFFDHEDFVNVDGPIFTPNACEGTTNLFQTKYFEQEAFLSQSAQLYMEAAAVAHGKVYSFGPTFRAEKSKTRRHLTEFWMVEPEMAYATLDDSMDLAERMICYVIKDVLAKNARDLETLQRDVSKLEAVKGGFPRMTYTEAVERLNAEGVEMKWGDDFGAPHETAIGDWFEQPVMVHRWPKETKAFYMATDPDDERLVLGVDIIAPEGRGEIVGGAQRSDSLEHLVDQIRKHELPMSAFEWYLDLRRYGACPLAGFGLGLERFVSWISGVEHVRECIPFPRTIYRISP